MQRIAVSSVVGVLFLIASGPSAWAIGPQNQTINPTNDSVVRVLFNAGLAGGVGQFNGSGSVIDNTDVNGVGVLCVLTADHVVSTTDRQGGATRRGLGIAFGNSGNDSGNSVYMEGFRAARGGPTGVEDIALLSVAYGAFNPLLDFDVVNLVPATAFFPYTDIGYGNQGNLVAGGYQGQFKYGTQRYLNNRVGVYASPMNVNIAGYSYEAAEAFVQNPAAVGAIAGAGAGFDGDSGSPWLSSSSNGTYFTDNQFAVFTANQEDNTGFIAFNTAQFADALSAADIQWIQQQCALAVPLPPSAWGGLVLSALVIGGRFVSRWRCA